MLPYSSHHSFTSSVNLLIWWFMTIFSNHMLEVLELGKITEQLHYLSLYKISWKNNWLLYLFKFWYNVFFQEIVSEQLFYLMRIWGIIRLCQCDITRIQNTRLFHLERFNIDSMSAWDWICYKINCTFLQLLRLHIYFQSWSFGIGWVIDALFLEID